MAHQTLFDRLRDRALTFRAAKGGNVIMTFALATVPIMGFVGSAVDYSRANSAKAAMQMAIDATGLMLSKNISTMTQEQINEKATAYFKAMFNRPEVTNVTVTPTYSNSGAYQITVTADGTVPTTFMKVAGFESMKINATSTVKWGNTRLRVALALDVTGSMSSAGKMDALKTATKNLLTQLKSAAAQNGDVYVSIVPFNKDVNAGAANYNATWIDWTEWDENNGNCTNYSGWNKPKSKSSCLNKSGTWTAANHNTWNGCIMDRGDVNGPSAQNFDTNVDPPVVGVAASRYPAEQYGYCPSEVMGLSYDWTALTAKVNALSPDGNTNQGVGLSWGWLSVAGGGPFTVPAKDPNYQYNEVIILLTDGLNTENRWYNNQASIDAREQITCNNINAAGITLYTVQVNTGNDATSTLLKNCAGTPAKNGQPAKYPDPDKFFLLTSANAIVKTFEQIATELSNLRVAK